MPTHRITTLLFSFLLLAMALAPLPANARGYEQRACGFDLDGDGRTGTPADCRICRGDAETETGSGARFVQFYVACGSGDDTASGTAAAPFATISRALREPVADDASRAVCFRGRCAPSTGEHFPLVPVSGQPKPATRDGFVYPAAPAILAGWDHNRDGIYPPADGEALLDGEGRTALAIANTRPASDLELAHFSARSFGAASGGGFMQISRNGAAERIWLHDLELEGINAGLPRVSSTITFNFFGGRDRHHVAIENVEIDGFGGYLARGSGGHLDAPAGPYRFRQLTARGHGGELDSITGFKLWDPLDGVEIAESVFDLNAAAWRPCSGREGIECEPSPFLHAAQCSAGWRVHHNEIRGFKSALLVKPDGGAHYCRERDLDDLYFANNEIIDEGTDWRWGDTGVLIKKGKVRGIGRIVIRDNTFRTFDGWESCIRSEASRSDGEATGSVEIAGNACLGSAHRYGAIAIGVPRGGLGAVPTQNYRIRGNAIRDLGTKDANLNLGYWPTALALDDNEWAPGHALRFPGGSTSVPEIFKQRLEEAVGTPPAAPVLLDVRPLR